MTSSHNPLTLAFKITFRMNNEYQDDIQDDLQDDIYISQINPHTQGLLISQSKSPLGISALTKKVHFSKNVCSISTKNVCEQNHFREKIKCDTQQRPEGLICRRELTAID